MSITKFNASDKKILQRIVEKDRQLKEIIKKKERSLSLQERKVQSALLTYNLTIVKKRRLEMLKLIKSIKFLKSLTL
jgi:hypothetical protein